MIRLRDAAKLAGTKLRTRKVRLAVTVIIAGLLFSALAAASQVSRGAFDSLASFNREGFGERYILATMPGFSGSAVDPASLPEVVSRTEAIQKQRIADKSALAKRLGIAYDPKAEAPATSEYDGPNGRVKGADQSHPAGRQALREYYAAHPGPGLAALQKQAAGYEVSAYYSSKSLGFSGSPNLQLLKDGKEPYTTTPSAQAQNPFEQRGLASFTSNWGLMSRDLLEPFLLPGADSAIGKDGSIPLLAPYSAVEQLLGHKSLPENTEPARRLERIKQVRQQAAGVSFQACYRNQASTAALQEAIAQQKEIAANKAKKDYTPPSLIYGLPQTPCGPVVVQSDKRPAAEKALAAKQRQLEDAFSGIAPPEQRQMTFRVIGITPDPPGFSASVVSSLVSSIVSSNLSLFGPSWFTPLELEPASPAIKAIFDTQDSPQAQPFPTGQHYVEFEDAASAKRFMANETCQPEFQPGATDPFAACTAQGKRFSFIPFGSNALALEDVKTGFSQVFTYAALAVAVVAAIIMVGTVGRTVADSRRETAVFRAIGAKKADIVTIYVIYSLFLSLLIFGFALALGFGAAQLVHGRYSDELTIQSLVAYNAADLDKVFNLYSFYAPDILKLLGLALAGGLLSAFFPLLRNLRRNPISDMRDEN